MVWHSCIVVNSKNHFCQREEEEEMMKRRRHKPGRSVTLLQHARGPHWGGSVHHRSHSWKVYSALIRGGRDAIRYQFLFSFGFHSLSSYTSTIQAVSCQYWKRLPFIVLFKKKQTINCATKLWSVVPPLCGTLWYIEIKKFSLSYFRLYQCNWW